jgi:hypothetical protein
MRDKKWQSPAGPFRPADGRGLWRERFSCAKSPEGAKITGAVAAGGSSESIRSLRRIVGEGLRVDEPMSRHTTIGVGGAARIMVVPRSMEQVVKLVRYARSAILDYVVLGKGSNLIVRDGGFDGMVIKMGTHLSKVRVNRIWSSASASRGRWVVRWS